MTLKKNKILFVTNDYLDATTSRVSLKMWLKSEHDITMKLASPLVPGGSSNHIAVPLSGRGITYSNLTTLNREINQGKYGCVVFRGIENIVLSAFLAIPKEVNVVLLLTGLGKAFAENLRFKRLIRFVYRLVLRFCVSKNKSHLIVQNSEDYKDLSIGSASIIDGSGYSMSASADSKKSDHISVVTATRLIEEKGINEILNFAEKIVKNNAPIKYTVLGDYSSLDQSYISRIEALNRSESIAFKGHRDDVSSFIKCSHFAYYPTKYREGVPRFLIESLAAGLVVFTNSMPGCSGVVSNGNGHLDFTPDEVFRSILNMARDEVESKGQRSRNLFVKKYSDSVVYPKYLGAMIKQ